MRRRRAAFFRDLYFAEFCSSCTAGMHHICVFAQRKQWNRRTSLYTRALQANTLSPSRPPDSLSSCDDANERFLNPMDALGVKPLNFLLISRNRKGKEQFWMKIVSNLLVGVKICNLSAWNLPLKFEKSTTKTRKTDCENLSTKPAKANYKASENETQHIWKRDQQNLRDWVLAFLKTTTVYLRSQLIINLFLGELENRMLMFENLWNFKCRSLKNDPEEIAETSIK